MPHTCHLKIHHAEIPVEKSQRASVCEHVESEIDVARREWRFKTKDQDLPFELADVATDEQKKNVELATS